MRRIFSLVVCWMFFTVAAPLSLAASIPQVINYQGSLTNRTGTPVSDGTYNIEFNIYDVATGGSSLWKEKWDATTSPVVVSGGVFNVMLGALNALPANFFAEHPTSYLGVKVGADSEMLPRQRISSVGYAFAAGNGIPEGGIIMWSGAVNQIPDGWALCDGTNGTPNLRDRFVVGAGGGYAKGQTGGESAHVLTIAEMPSHAHTDSGHGHGSFPLSNNDGGANSWEYRTGTGSPTINWSIATGNANIQPSGGGQPHNNLPPYYALAFIMKL